MNFHQAAIKKLIEDLRQVRVQRLGATWEEAPAPAFGQGSYVEPVQLQVVCSNLWEAPRLNPNEITPDDVSRWGGVDTALGDYYNRKVNEIVANTHVGEESLRVWLGNTLITEQGLRNQVIAGMEKQFGLNQAVLDQLEDAYLVRREERGGRTWYELSHDRLVDPLRKANEAWRKSRPAVKTPGELGTDLEKTGWGVVFPAEVDPEPLKQALMELLDHRRLQAGKYYREFSGLSGYRAKEKAAEFLARQGTGFGLPDPQKVPYYLLLVGSPAQIPFEFQSELDVQYAAGRIYFDKPEEYHQYARSVVHCETGGVRLPNRAVIYAPRNSGDSFTNASVDSLAAPLARRLSEAFPAIQIEQVFGRDATKQRLASLLSGGDAPTVFFSTTHGIQAADQPGDPLQVSGALVCQDWPGPDRQPGALEPDQFFTAQDVSDQARLLGTIAFLFNPFSLGIPQFDEYAFRVGAQPARRLADQPVLARLPQRLLSHPSGGALAAIGLTGAGWLEFFSDTGQGQNRTPFEVAMERLLQGYTAGMVLEAFNQQYALLSAQLAEQLNTKAFLPGMAQDQELIQLRSKAITARQFALLGDPAVRLPVDPSVPFETPKAGWQRPAFQAAGDLLSVEPTQPANLPKGILATLVRPSHVEQTRPSPEALTSPAITPPPLETVSTAAGTGLLEISLSSPVENQYYAVMRFSSPDEASEPAPAGGRVTLDFQSLRAASFDPASYGRLLSESLFTNLELRIYFSQSLAVISTRGLRMTLHILIDRSAIELGNLRWELLLNPDTGQFLAVDENVAFSRFVVSSDWSRFRLKPRGRLNALVVIANPLELRDGLTLGGQQLTLLDLTAEVERARAALGGIEVTVLASDSITPGKASFENLAYTLRRGYDILYLACHAALLPADPGDSASRLGTRLLLERPDGSYHLVADEQLVELIRNLHPDNRPRLIVLLANQTAALAHSLTQAGGAAAIAMQENITLETTSRFMPAFFSELLRDGQVERAMQAARQIIRERADWWAPVLFSRLHSGKLWYEPGFGMQEASFEAWASLQYAIKSGEALPILGIELFEYLVGPLSDIARRIAEEYRFPLQPSDIGDLPQVTQYIAINQGARFVPRLYIDYLRRSLIAAYITSLPEELLKPEYTPDELISYVGRARRQADPHDPYRSLAGLPFRIYLTANPDRLLEDALREQGRNPTTLFSIWNRSLVNPDRMEEYRNLSELNVEQPLVYHLFGVLSQPSSLVITEQDLFDFLRWFTNRKVPIPVPDVILSALIEQSCIMLGFRMQEASFRALYRIMFSEEIRHSIKDYKSTMIMSLPSDEFLRPEQARRYFEKYFAKDQWDIYWGSAIDFLRDLNARLKADPQAGPGQFT